MVTEKYKDIITSSDLKCEELPAVYQLSTKMAKIGIVKRMTVGEKNLNKPNKTLLLVGETGAGKSTLINTLVNYAMGVNWMDEVWFQIVAEEDKSQTEIQTSDVIIYEIFGFEDETLPYSLTVIDTPGFGDTRGTEQDDIIIQRLFDLFQSEDGVREIHSVGLVMKAGENRLSGQMKYIFDSVMSLFGKDLQKNIVALITHSDGMPPTKVLEAVDVAKIHLAKDSKSQPLYFLFNNQQNTERTEQNEFGLEMAWTVTQRGMAGFTAFLREITPQKPEAAIEVLKECTRLTACIQNLQERMKFTEVKEREMKQIQEALKKQQEEKKNEDLTAFNTEVYKDKECIREGCAPGFEAAVCCTVCEENCHFPGCTVALTLCEVFKGSCSTSCNSCTLGQSCPPCTSCPLSPLCTSCTKKCPVSNHVKEKWRYVTRIKKIKNEKNQTESGNKLSLLENVEKQINKLAEEKSQLMDEAYQHVEKLEEITLNLPAHSVSTYVHLDSLIEKMKDKRDKEKVQKLEEMRSRVDEGTRAALQYKLGLISSRYEDIMSNSFLIHSRHPAVYKDIITSNDLKRKEPPAVYQLRPKKEMIGTLTKMTVGEKNPNMSNKMLLLVGETGTGKSTLINALVNYAMGVKWEDEVWFQIVEEEEKKKGHTKGQTEGHTEGHTEGQYESQTSDVIVYEIFGFEDKTLPYSLTIIDTPGFGDTRGGEQDDIISHRLLDLFRSDDGIIEIHAVGLVMQAGENRLSDRLMYIFNSVMSLFGKNVEKQIVALMTHSSGTPPQNALKALEVAKIKCAKNKKNRPVHFLFDNCQCAERTEETKASLKHSWDNTQKEMGNLTEFLGKSGSQKLMTTVEVLNERIRLKACIQNLQERIEFIEEKKKQIQQTEEAVNQHKEEMEKNQNFYVEVDEPFKDYEKIEPKWWYVLLGYDKAVYCNVCKENCHYPGCTMAKQPESCWVMKDGSCTVCKNKCPASKHEKDKKKYVTKTKKVKQTIEEVKEKYEKSKSESENKSNLLENLKKEMIQWSAEMSLLLDESYQHVVRLEQIALNVDSVSTLIHLDFLIQKMKEKGDTEKVQKLEAMRNRVDERLRAAHWYKLVQIPSAIKRIVSYK